MAGLRRDRVTPEEAYMGRVARLRCVICRRLDEPQEGKTDVHHLRHGEGMQQRAPAWLSIALCHGKCHQGPRGLHGDRGQLLRLKADEVDLLAWTIEDLNTLDTETCAC